MFAILQVNHRQCRSKYVELMKYIYVLLSHLYSQKCLLHKEQEAVFKHSQNVLK